MQVTGGLELKYLIFIPVVCFSLTFDFHTAWLAVDFLYLSAWVYYFKRGYDKMLFVLLLPFLYWLGIGGGDLGMKVLSFWDTFKSLVIFMFIVDAKRIVTGGQQDARKFAYLLIYLVYVQWGVCAYQYAAGYHFDNVAGMLGNGSTHAMGYLALVALVAVFYMGFPLLHKVLTVLVFFTVNWWGENVGLFVLVVLFLPVVLLLSNKGKGLILLIPVVVLFCLFILMLSENEVLAPYYNRVLGIFDIDVNMLDFSLAGRQVALSYALYLGGFFGDGAGIYSQIYGRTGIGFWDLENTQLNISEVAHLISEVGVLGFLQVLILYLYVLLKVDAPKYKMLICSVFLIICFFYNRFLMDERSVFFVALAMCYFLHWSHKETNAVPLE